DRRDAGVLRSQPAQQLTMEPLDQRVAGEGQLRGLAQVEGVDRQGADDQVALGEAGGHEEALEVLARLARQCPPAEGGGVRALVGENEEAELPEAPAIDGPGPERRVRRDAKGRKVGPAKAWLATGQEPREVGGRAGVEVERAGARRLIGQVTGIVGVAFLASLRR